MTPVVCGAQHFPQSRRLDIWGDVVSANHDNPSYVREPASETGIKGFCSLATSFDDRLRRMGHRCSRAKAGPQNLGGHHPSPFPFNPGFCSTICCGGMADEVYSQEDGWASDSPDPAPVVPDVEPVRRKRGRPPGSDKGIRDGHN